jgi:hypothetical protein
VKRSSMTKDILWSRLSRFAPVALAAIAVLLATGSANAACGPQVGSRLGALNRMPFLAQAQPLGKAEQTRNNPIVGLWHVTYTSGGQLFFESLDQWHSDGSEFENANALPTEGNICFGVWKKTGPRTVQLFHIGWNFDTSGNPIGTFTIQETNTVARGGATYQGTFDYKVYDVDGNLLFEATGTQAATRITVN